MQALASLLLAVALLAGCASKPTPPPPEPAPQVQPEPPPAAPPVPLVVGPAAKAQAQKAALHGAELLEEGNADEARLELQQALAADPGNRIAATLMKQLSADPLAALGKEFFNYTVRPGDTLSRIAGRFLGDIYQFHILARYNDIRVPKQVQVGQVIKVPGKAPPPSALAEPGAAPKRPGEGKPAEGRKPRAGETAAAEKPPAAPPLASPARPVVAPPPAETEPEPVSRGERSYQSGLQAMKAGDKEKAYAAFMQAAKLDPQHKDAKAKAAQLRQELIQRYHRNATAAFHRQDMDTAIRQWDKVLVLDPDNESAKLNRQRALDLSQRIKQIQ